MSYKLYYFPIRGLGEPIRLLFEDAGQKYEDIHVGENWPAKKQEFASRGPANFGQMPVLEDGDFFMTQSTAILRYAAKALGYYGGDAKTQYICDAVDDGVNKDWRKPYVEIAYPKDASKYPELKANYIDGPLKKYLGIYEDILKNTGNQFIAGKDITFADFSLWEMLDISNTLAPSTFAQYPLLHAYYQRIAERPNIKAYLASGRRAKQVNGRVYVVKIQTTKQKKTEYLAWGLFFS
jgi:glutathione S-transferase